MILAAITLLSMSLNAQTTYEKVTNSNQLVVGNKYILVSEAQNLAVTKTATGNNYLAGEAVTITNSTVTLATSSNVAEFTLGGSVGAWTLANGSNYLNGNTSGYLRLNSNATTWTITNDNGNLSGFRVKQSDQSRAVIYQTTNSRFGNYAYSNVSNNPNTYSYAWLYVEASTAPTIQVPTNSVNMSAAPGGTATETVSVTGRNLTGGINASISGTDASVFGVSPASLGTTGGTLTITYSPTAVGTHTATLTLTEVNRAVADPVTITLNGTSSNDVTVCDGTNTNGYLPIYAYYYDNYQKNQMIYPENLLSGLAGKKITSMTFYANGNFNWSGGEVTARLATTDQTSYSSKVRLQPSDMAIVASGFDVPSSGNTWTITFTTPFEYNSGNLVIDMEETSCTSGYGHYSSSSFAFYGVTRTGGGFYSNADTRLEDFSSVYSGGSVQNFLPKVTFTYEENTPRHDLGITLSEPTAVTAGENATITATVTNHGNQTETGYTVTFSDGTNTFSTQTGGTLAPGATETFTATYTTSAAGTVTITANVACTGDADATNDEATTNLTVNAPVHDLGIALTATDEVVGGNDVTLTATVTNTGDLTETGYTVTFSDGTNTFSTQTGGTLAPGATETFTATYTTTAAQGGTTVTFTATVTCTGDADATNDEATASTAVILLPPPTNVVATPDGANATVTWNAPVIAPVAVTVTEDFEDTSVFPSFSTGGIDANTHTGAFGDWTLYDATGGCVVYGSKQLDYDNESVPLAWFVFKPSGATASEDYPDAVPHDVHSGAQYLESICPTSSSSAAGVSDHWLISPELSGLAQTISFYVCEMVTDYGSETYEIWVSTTDNDPSSFTKLADYSISYETWAQQSLQLPAGTKYFAIRHTSNDKFGLLIDDVTYEGLVPGVQPTSYNIYQEGQLVGNVDANTFSYTFNNLNDGTYNCAVSAVYSYGESAAVPTTFTIDTTNPTIEISPATQTISDAAAGALTVTGTDIDGNINVSAANNDWTVNPTSLGNTGGNVSVTYTGRDLIASTTVTASATGATDASATVNYVADLYIVGNFGSGWDFNNGTHMSYNNGIYTTTLTVNANAYILFARLLGNSNPWNTRDVFGPSSNGNWDMQGDNYGGDLNLWGSSCIHFPEGGTYTITINANDGTFTITRLLEGQTAPPVITTSSDGEYVTITATGDGTVTLNVPGYAPVSGEGEVSITVPCGYVSNSITVTATAKESGKTESEAATAVINIPAGSDWVEMDGTYNATDLLSFQKNQEDIMLIDQFAESTLKNDHPDHYTYTLRQTVNGETETSTPVTIPVYKTSSTMQGLYTQNQVTGDTDMKLKPNVFNTEMDYEVNPDRNVLYYSLYRGEKDAYYPEIKADQRISQLQKFEEMVNGQVQYFMFENHQEGVAPRYDHVGHETVERLDTNWVEGDLDQMLAYVPVVWTFGLYTARGDGKNNSYGSDIKREYMGKVTANITGQISQGDYGTWEDVNGTTYRAFHPTITVTGFLPQNNTNNVVIYNDGDEATYVPYMCRAWCTNEGIHDYGRDADGQLTDLGALPTPFLVGEATFGDDLTATIGGNWTHGSVRDPWSFGLPTTVTESEVTFIIRFYYKKVVTEGQQNGSQGKFIGGAAEEYFMAQTEGDADDMVVALNEFMNGIVPVDVTYVNPQGMQSSRPFDGVNIVVTRYSDGSTRTSKIVR